MLTRESKWKRKFILIELGKNESSWRLKKEKQEPKPDFRLDADSRDSQSWWGNLCSSGVPLFQQEDA
ncbi:unnamed protein product [Trifolium pratense]|uniref:Uncharacterized protein n=1 Tax=Trifolium pratense TaxID=57577 RepID=A0ACB0LLT4_TRIPR|nr:unnamed protein product [Trifolium pratense]